MPLSRGAVIPHRYAGWPATVADLVDSGPKCHTVVVSLVLSIDTTWSYPAVLGYPAAGSQIAFHVKITSSEVSGEPSDHLRPDFKVTVISMCVGSTTLMPPLSVAGTWLTRSGTGTLV